MTEKEKIEKKKQKKKLVNIVWFTFESYDQKRNDTKTKNEL